MTSQPKLSSHKDENPLEPSQTANPQLQKPVKDTSPEAKGNTSIE
jgi:hypothetical protein